MTKLTILLPDDIAERVSRRPDRDEFVRRAVSEALAQESRQKPRSAESRWARIVRRIEAHPTTLGSYAEQDRRHRDRFREETLFPDDQP